MKRPTVWVVTPVHNRRHYTEPFLRCLHRQSWSELRIIIIDDGSTDGTREMIRHDFPQVILLRGDGNLWWTAAMNLGVRHALTSAQDQDYILALNDDIEIDATFVSTLVRFATSHSRSLVGGVVVPINDSQHVADGGVVINWWTAKHRVLNRGTRLADLPPNYAVQPSYLTGRCALIPVKVFREVGLYDERHFINCGDTELPVRATRHNYQLYVTYGAVVKSHVDAVQAINKPGPLSFRGAAEYFFGIKSYARLRYRFHFARTAAGDNHLRFAVYFLCDLVRITAHFVSRLAPTRRGLHRPTP